MYMVSKYIRGKVNYIVLDEEEKERVKDKKCFGEEERVS
jgi:hypothetical protein